MWDLANEDDSVINVPRLMFFSVTILGYSMKEARLLTPIDICMQYEEYLKYRNINIEREGGF